MRILQILFTTLEDSWLSNGCFLRSTANSVQWIVLHTHSRSAIIQMTRHKIKWCYCIVVSCVMYYLQLTPPTVEDSAKFGVFNTWRNRVEALGWKHCTCLPDGSLARLTWTGYHSDGPYPRFVLQTHHASIDIIEYVTRIGNSFLYIFRGQWLLRFARTETA